ncbi:MAG TPA: tetratricopeptide repeat protein [Hyphomicrobium zavarzinii]|nr:tetratricopeptide repeat protein [Hyphomicrobium zavarzinii]
MSLTLIGWLLIVSSVAVSAPLMVSLLTKASRKERLDLAWSALPQDIHARLKLRKLNTATSGSLVAAAAAFLAVAGIGTATSYVAKGPEPSPAEESDGAILARLDDYTRSIGPVPTASADTSASTSDKMLPDVSTMIERLAARLEAAPGDVQGWRMLGWSYFNTGRYAEAAGAYARAVELDPSSEELKRALDQAKTKVSESNGAEMRASSQTAPEGTGTPDAGKEHAPEARPSGEQGAAIRSMVDGLAERLESAPRDIEGWTRLMRSRVVLGEREAATAAFRKALEVFKDDATASGQIMAAAAELGLKTE